MKKSILTSACFCLLMIGTTSATVDAKSKVPDFIEKGENYVFMLPGAGPLDVKVLDIDESTGWVEISSKDRNLQKGWMNVATLLAITSGSNETVKTVDWYKNNKVERDLKIEECRNNPGELEGTPNCKNAKAAMLAASSGSLTDFGSLIQGSQEKEKGSNSKK